MTTGNVHFPELKCQLPKGTRMYAEDGKVTVNERTVDQTENFQIMVRYNLVRKLTEEEEQLPEKVEAPKVLVREERKKMRVEQEEDNIVPIVGRFSSENGKGGGVLEHEADEELKEEVEGEGTVRGMKVIYEDSTPIVKPLPKSNGDQAPVKSNGDQAPVKSKAEVRPAPKAPKSGKTEEQKKAEAAALKAKRLKGASASTAAARKK